MTVSNENLSPGPWVRAASSIDPAVLTGIRQASQSTHTDFSYLMAQAAQESGFQSDRLVSINRFDLARHGAAAWRQARDRPTRRTGDIRRGRASSRRRPGHAR